MILVVLLLDDVGSRGKGKFLMMGKYSRIQHHFSKGHSKRCTGMFGGRRGTGIKLDVDVF